MSTTCFRSCPEHYLPKITQRVKKLCEDHAVPFTVAAGFFDANNKVLKTLNNATRNIGVVLSRKDSHASTPSVGEPCERSARSLRVVTSVPTRD